MNRTPSLRFLRLLAAISRGSPPRRDAVLGGPSVLRVLLLALLFAGPARAADPAPDAFSADVRALCAFPHRLAGSAECDAAADYVAARLAAAGLAQVYTQRFFVPFMETECSLRLDGREVPVYALRANLWQGPVSGGAPLQGRTLIVGNGAPEGYRDQEAQDRIVVMNYGTATRWRDAFAMGAKAIVFVEAAGVPLPIAFSEPIPADLPRFYVREQDAAACGLLDREQEATLAARARWTRRESVNVLAWIPGEAPRFSLENDEAVVLSAQLDSFGEVPGLANGARGAANCAALLDVARRLASARPKRNVLLAFLGGEGLCLSGSSALYSAVFRATPFRTYNRTHADFVADYEAESAFQGMIAAAMQAGDLYAPRGEAGRQALDMLRREAQYQTTELQAALRELRLERDRLARAGDSANAAALDARIAAVKADEQRGNSLQRALAKELPTAAVQAQFAQVRNACTGLLESRRAELARMIEHRREDQRIGGLLTNSTLVLHLSLDLGDRGSRWGIAHGDEGYYLPGAEYNNIGYYVSVFAGLASAVEHRRGADAGPLALLEPETTRVQLGPPLYFPMAVLHAGQMASRFGVYGLRVGTCHDALPLLGHPQDRLDRLDEGRFRSLASDAAPFVAALASAPELSLRQRIRPTATFQDTEWHGSKVEGWNVMTRTAGTAIANRPARGGMLAFLNPAHLPGFDLAIRCVVQQNGLYTLGPLPVTYPLDRWCGALFDEAGRISAVNTPVTGLQRIEMFPCAEHTVVALAPPDFRAARSMVLNAVNDGQFLSTEFLCMEQGPTATFFTPVSARGAKVVNSYGLALLNADEKHPTGQGFPLGARWKPVSTEKATANDLCALNEHRLDILRKRRITNDSVEWLHGLARAALRRAGDAPTTAARYAELAMSRMLARRVYQPVLDSMNDLVKAVVILMLLMIPFAYSLERLIIGTPHIYRQIGWYGFFFLATFAILYAVHPAFAIAAEPIVIFLAFVIIILSAIVIFILLSRFQSEIKAAQGLRMSVHTADVSRFGTVMAAVSMGISTMRRRPVRTVLTTVTVILLTYSILSFASFDAQGGILRRHVAAATESRCIFLHHALWAALPERLLDAVRHIAGPSARVTARRWLSATSYADAQTFRLLVSDESGEKTGQIDALVGIEAPDIEAQPDLKACFPSLAPEAGLGPDDLLLPAAAAERLGVQIGAPVLLRGRRFRFAGTVEEKALTRFLQIDQSPLLPVNYGDESMAMQAQADSGQGDAKSMETANLQSESAFLPYCSAGRVAIVHESAARDIGGRLVALSAYPKESSETLALAERIARICPAPLFATLSDGIYRFYFTTVLATSGMSSLVIPIILGGLIVFGTMLGSVSDREKEIYAFSALGLAPAHIATLFFAEASVYAVVGGLGGYILSQVVAFTTAWLSTFTPLSSPAMNYSSTNAIFAILVVMATVLLSTVYPALVASRSANPGVARAWRLPRPTGDAWSFAFPFTVSEYDITGVMSFLLEHFGNFSDCSLGVFLAESPSVSAEGRSLRLRSRVATAPFDLGVTQDFCLTSQPSEIEGVDEVHVSINRLSGTRGDWARTNRPFISDLRRQFLIWRSLPPETMELYRRRTLDMLGKAGEAGKADAT